MINHLRSLYLEPQQTEKEKGCFTAEADRIILQFGLVYRKFQLPKIWGECHQLLKQSLQIINTIKSCRKRYRLLLKEKRRRLQIKRDIKLLISLKLYGFNYQVINKVIFNNKYDDLESSTQQLLQKHFNINYIEKVNHELYLIIALNDIKYVYGIKKFEQLVSECEKFKEEIISNIKGMSFACSNCINNLKFQLKDQILKKLQEKKVIPQEELNILLQVNNIKREAFKLEKHYCSN